MAAVPTVSVIMPVYNGEGFISQAMRSILEQSLQDLELIVVTEFGSSQASIAEVDAFDDPRVVHIRNEERLGLIASLNLGLQRARGKYIARMDSDDVSLPTRLERQVAYLDAHPEVGVLGTMVAYIDERGRRTSRPRYFSTSDMVAWDRFFNSPVPHPSAMMRADVVDALGGYDPGAKLVEDYDLWLRASKVSYVTNLEEELVLVRKHGENITVTQRREQNRAASRLAWTEIEQLLGKKVDGEDVYRLRHPSEMSSGAEAVRAAELLNEIYGRFVTSRKIGYETLAEIRKDMQRKYSTLIALGMKRRWRVTGALLELGGREADVGRAAVLAEAVARRALRN